MTEAKPGQLVGAMIGASVAPAAMIGAAWSGLGSSSAAAWLMTIVFGGLLGGLTLDKFLAQDELGAGFGALFGASCGLLAGALGGGPVAGVFGFCCGAGAGLSVAWVNRRVRVGSILARCVTLWGTGACSAALIGWGMTQ